MRSKFADPGTRAIGAIVAEGFLSRLSFGLVWIVVAFYARYELQMSFFAVGFLIVLNTLIAIVLKPIMGAVADRVGRKRTLVVAMVFRSAVTLLYVVATGPLFLFAARVVHGVAIGLRDPAISALIADNGGKKQIAQSFAWYQTAKSVAGNAAKASGLFLLYFTGSYSLVFVLAFVLSMLPLYVVVRYVRETERNVSVVAAAVPAAAADAAPPEKPKGRVIAAFAGLGFLISATAYSVSSFFPLLAKEYAHLNEAQIGLILSVVVVVPFTGPFFGWLADNVNAKLVLSFRSLANVGSSALYLAFPSFGGLAAGRIMDDMGKAAFKPAWGAMAAQLSSFDKKNRAKTMGYVSSGEDAGEISGTMGVGVILTLGGGVAILPAVLIGRMALAGFTEVYTIVFAKTYLEEKVATQGRVVRRFPMPVRVTAAVIAGFASGFLVQQLVKPSEQPAAQPTTPVHAAKPAAAPQDAGCTGNETVDAIRRQIGVASCGRR